jgi:hypothetical protein
MRKEQRELVFGRDEQEQGHDEEKKERKRKRSIEKVKAANERWGQGYASTSDLELKGVIKSSTI